MQELENSSTLPHRRLSEYDTNVEAFQSQRERMPFAKPMCLRKFDFLFEHVFKNPKPGRGEGRAPLMR
jgi:hypothetical protein